MIQATEKGKWPAGYRVCQWVELLLRSLCNNYYNRAVAAAAGCRCRCRSSSSLSRVNCRLAAYRYYRNPTYPFDYK